MEHHRHMELGPKGRIMYACVGGLVYELEGLRYGELTMHMCGMCKLVLVTLARVAK